MRLGRWFAGRTARLHALQFGAHEPEGENGKPGKTAKVGLAGRVLGAGVNSDKWSPGDHWIQPINCLNDAVESFSWDTGIHVYIKAVTRGKSAL